MENTQSKIDQLIEGCLATLKEYSQNPPAGIYESLTDARVLNGLSILGATFQANFSLALLREIGEEIDNPVISNLTSKLEDFISTRKLTGFNYFYAPYIPDDLDTASMVVRNFPKNKELWNELTRRVQANTNGIKTIQTWFTEKNNYERGYWTGNLIHTSGESSQTEVIVNYLLAQTNSTGATEIPLLDHVIGKFGLSTYFYFPSFYTTDLYATLLLKLGSKVTELSPGVLILQTLLQKAQSAYPTMLVTNRCRIEVVQELVTRENTIANWLNLSYILSSIGKYRKCTGLSGFDDFGNQVLADMVVTEKLPSLYWSIGLTPFTSKFLVHLILLRNILQFKNN
jgi:hypothetical protein